MNTTRIVKQLFAAFFLCAFASAQTPTGESKRYAQDGLSFDYPAGWTLADKSNQRAQHLILKREGGSALVVVIAYRELISKPEQLLAANQNVWKPYAEDMARKLGIDKTPPWEETQCQQVGGRQAVGVKLGGRLSGEPTTGEIYALMLGRRFVNVFFVRYDKDEARESPGWNALIESLKVDEPVNAPPLMLDRDLLMVGALNGKAIVKPQPTYPPIARSARASGTVSIHIMVDENGKVTSAEAVSGHPLLRASGEQAARGARFSPTKLCGKPVKVTGIITYNFVLQ